MVQKYCPTCKDLIPVACKSCPCGHKFVKTIPDSGKPDQSESSEKDTKLGREENGRPRRKSAMNSLYYHSSLQLSSYKLAKQAAVMSAKRKSSTDALNGEGTTNGVDHPITNGRSPIKRPRGRPRLTPLTEAEMEAAREMEMKAEAKPKEEEYDYPTLRQRRPGLISNTLRSSRDIYDNPLHSTTSKTSKANRAIIESESYTKLYQTLSLERKAHFAHILTDINFKFQRNANFPL